MLAGRHAIVTGAASGIGAAAARALDEAGASVTKLDVSAGEGIIACDVTDERAVESAFADATPFTDVLHAAGIMSTGEVSTLALSDFRRVIDVNLIGSFLVARASARRIADRGTITLVASQAGRKGGAGWSAYCASKFGLIGLVESLAQELAARGVRVNAVCPGTIDTPMTRLAINQLADHRSMAPASYSRRLPRGNPVRPVWDTGRSRERLRVPRLAARRLRLGSLDRRRRGRTFMSVRRLNHVSLTVADIDASLAFWHDVLGLAVLGRGVVEYDHLDRIIGVGHTRIEWAELAIPGGTILELFRYLEPEGHPIRPGTV